MKHHFEKIFAFKDFIKCSKCNMWVSISTKRLYFGFGKWNEEIIRPVLFKNGHAYNVVARTGKKLNKVECEMSLKDSIVKDIIK